MRGRGNGLHGRSYRISGCRRNGHIDIDQQSLSSRVLASNLELSLVLIVLNVFSNERMAVRELQTSSFSSLQIYRQTFARVTAATALERRSASKNLQIIGYYAGIEENGATWRRGYMTHWRLRRCPIIKKYLKKVGRLVQ